MRSLDSQSLLAAFQRRSRSLIIGFTATVLIAVVVLEGVDLSWGYDRSIAIAEQKATNLASVLAEYMRGSFAVADTSLRQLAVHGTHVGGGAAGAAAWDPILEAARAAMPADRRASSNDVSFSLCLPTPLVKNISFGTKLNTAENAITEPTFFPARLNVRSS